MKIEYVLKAVNIMYGVDAQWNVLDVATALEEAYRDGFEEGWSRERDYSATKGHTVPMNEHGPVSQPSDHAYDELGY